MIKPRLLHSLSKGIFSIINYTYVSHVMHSMQLTVSVLMLLNGIFYGFTPIKDLKTCQWHLPAIAAINLQFHSVTYTVFYHYTALQRVEHHIVFSVASQMINYGGRTSKHKLIPSTSNYSNPCLYEKDSWHR